MQNSNEPLVKPTTLLISSIGAIFTAFGVLEFVGAAAFIPTKFRFDGDWLVLIGVGALFMSLPFVEIFKRTRERARTRGPGEL